MKKYNIQNYIRYKEDLKETLKLLPDYGDDYEKYTRKELVTKFLPLVETMARKFSTSDQASGILSIMDLIQEGSAGLTKAVDRLDHETLKDSEDKEKTLKSFFSKRIKGAIRRRIDMLRGNIRIPEHQLNKIRKDNGKDQKMVAMFFNSIFLSIDSKPVDDENLAYQIPDKSEPYNIQLMNIYLKSLMTKYLNEKEYEVLRLSYGLDCDKHSAKQIAAKLNITGASDYVRVSELKREAVQTLIDNVDHSQVLDYL
jgi:RNA polymerase sigma factor (sigma-70 family)